MLNALLGEPQRESLLQVLNSVPMVGCRKLPFWVVSSMRVPRLRQSSSVGVKLAPKLPFSPLGPSLVRRICRHSDSWDQAYGGYRESR